MDTTDDSTTGDTEVILEAGVNSTRSPTWEEIESALSGSRDDDWMVTLHRGDEDFMEAMIDNGDLWVEVEEGGRFLQARSYVDEAAMKSMFAAFREGDARWRDLAAWKEPAKAAQKAPPAVVINAGTFIAVVVIGCLATTFATNNAGWVVLMFALLFPGIVGLAAAVKAAEAKRAASWSKATAQIVRSEMVTETRNGKSVNVPRIEYEFPVSFHRYRGKRVNFAELIAGVDAKEALARFRVGASVPVYYNPADPNESVLERELPPFMRWVWVVVGVLVAAILAGGLYLLLR